jgi:site-specific recombinase XerD
MQGKKLAINRGNSTYTFPISDSLHVCLKDYLNMRNDFVANNNNSYTNYLFLSHTGNPYTPRAYQYKFKKALELADIEGKYTPQNVRSSFAYYMAQKHDEDTMRKILNQNKVSHFYIDEINDNPLIAYN